MKNVLTIPSIVAGSKNGGGAGGTTNYDNLTNKPKVNGVTLSGNKTSADLGITTLTPFPSTWPTTGKFEDLLAAIRVDTIAVKGASFLGEVTFDDLPANLGNAEIKVEILEGTTPATKVIHSVITSGNREPYRWEYTSWNSGNSNSGWISFQLPLTAGDGISIENNVISTTVGNVYTQSNLLAGKGIEIVDEPVEGGIDNHTLACWHFDEDFRDVISNIILPNGTLTAEHKFGTHGYSFGWPSSTEKVVTLNREKDFTIDFFIQLTNANTNLAWDGYFQGYSAQSLIVVHQDKLYMATTNGSTTSINLPNPLQLNTWNHIAFVYSFEDKIISAFVNGNKIGQLATTYPVADFNLNNFNGTTPWYIDELRISDIARPLTTDGKFPVPTQAYSVAVPTGNKVINNTGVTSINTKKGNVTLTADDINVTYTYEGAETTTSIKEFADTVDHNIENLNSLIPVNAYTAENLIAGKNITIEEVLPEGGIDSHTLACWHFDGDFVDAVNGLTIGTFDAVIDTLNYVFGTASEKVFERDAYWNTSYGSRFKADISSFNLTTSKQLTVDSWIKFNNGSDSYNFPYYYGFNYENSNKFGLAFSWNPVTKSLSFYDVNNESDTAETTIEVGSWHHVAYTYDGTDSVKKVVVYLDGEEILTTSYTINTNFPLTKFNLYHTSVYQKSTPDNNADELRISDIVRPLTPDGKFPVPTKAYSVAEPTGKVAINNAITKTSQLTNDSGFLTSVPENLVTTDSYQGITGRKDFADMVNFNGGMRASRIQLTNNEPVASVSGDATLFGHPDMGIEIRYNTSVNINTMHTNSGIIRPATLNGKQIATVDDIAAASSSVASVNTKTGNVVLTGADIQTTYTYNSKETTTTINAFADAVFHNIDNVTALIPTKAVTSDNVTKIVKLTQAEYDSLTTKDENTLYYIVG